MASAVAVAPPPGGPPSATATSGWGPVPSPPDGLPVRAAGYGSRPRAPERDEAGPATRAARPAVPAGPRPRSSEIEPPTDPRGFPRVRPASLEPDAGPDPDPDLDRAEASALAAAFAADYLSWDEDDPDRRARVLAQYRDGATGAPGPGWSGRGRQRAEFALPGAVRADGPGRVLVDVRVRVTPYQAIGTHGPAGPAPGEAGGPAAAPPPAARGWRALASQWRRLAVPVVLDGRRLVVEAGGEAWAGPVGGEPQPGASTPVPDPPHAAPPAAPPHTGPPAAAR